MTLVNVECRSKRCQPHKSTLPTHEGDLSNRSSTLLSIFTPITTDKACVLGTTRHIHFRVTSRVGHVLHGLLDKERR